MNVGLVAGGVIFLLLGFLLLVAAAIAFVVGRNRSAASPLPQSTVPPPLPVQPPPLPTQMPPLPMTPPASAEPDPNATVVVNTSALMNWGALHGIAGTLIGRVFPIEPNGYTIGRDRTMAQVVVEDPRVSKKHVWVGVKNGEVVAIDQNSTNGTFLNTLRLTESKLTPGDVLIISDDVTRLEYRR